MIDRSWGIVIVYSYKEEIKMKKGNIYGSGGALDLFFRLHSEDDDLSGIDIRENIWSIYKAHPRILKFLNQRLTDRERDYEKTQMMRALHTSKLIGKWTIPKENKKWGIKLRE